jgi:3-isopropylmalate/(R)-2-methylmalate dehydratase large subunit
VTEPGRGQTIAEKVFSAHVGHHVRAGEVVVSPVDFVFSHDANRPQPLETFAELGGTLVFDRERVAMFIDHGPNAHTPAIAEMHRRMTAFASEQGITLYPAGRGISHQVLAEEGWARPGAVIVGSDSHTCTAGAFNALATGVGSTDLAVAMKLGKLWFKVPETLRVIVDGDLSPGVYSKDIALYLEGVVGADGANYLSVEYAGSTIAGLTMEARMTVTNMAVEMGAKFGLMEVDAITRNYLNRHGVNEWTEYRSDPDAEVASEVYVDAAALAPLVSLPPNPDDVCPVDDLERTAIQQATIGTSTNGQIEDLRAAAEILRGRQVAPGVRLYVTPASRRALLAAQMEGLLEVFLEAGGLIGTPGCSGCTGASGFGVPRDGDVMITSANRNFAGRTGNNKAQIYLASPATVAASAVEGVIADPRNHLTRTTEMAR